MISFCLLSLQFEDFYGTSGFLLAYENTNYFNLRYRFLYVTHCILIYTSKLSIRENTTEILFVFGIQTNQDHIYMQAFVYTLQKAQINTTLLVENNELSLNIHIQQRRLELNTKPIDKTVL